MFIYCLWCDPVPRAAAGSSGCAAVSGEPAGECDEKYVDEFRRRRMRQWWSRECNLGGSCGDNSSDRGAALARGWRRAGLDRWTRAMKEETIQLHEALGMWSEAEQNMRTAAGEVAMGLQALMAAKMDTEYWSQYVEECIDAVVTSSHKRGEAEGMALRGFNSVSSCLPIPWWEHKEVQTMKKEEVTWTWHEDRLEMETDD